MVFVGVDNEDKPIQGGIYLAPLSPSPELTPVAGIGDPVPGEEGQTFNRFGEALSFDGRYVGFWAAWGDETKTLWLDCPADGNRDLIAFCEEFIGDNFPVEVPVNQGMFVADTQTGTITKVARTDDNFSDFLFWNFSGKPPGVGGSEDESDDGELPRWRSSAFISVSRDLNGAFLAAFKARTGEIDDMEKTYIDPVDGIYVGNSAEVAGLLDTTLDGQLLDPDAPEGSIIATLALERESFRGPWLAITASMVEESSEEGMAGIYLTSFPTPQVNNPGNSGGQGNISNDNGTETKISKKKAKRQTARLKKRIKSLKMKIRKANSEAKKIQLRLKLESTQQQLTLLRNGAQANQPKRPSFPKKERRPHPPL